MSAEAQSVFTSLAELQSALSTYQEATNGFTASKGEGDDASLEDTDIRQTVEVPLPILGDQAKETFEKIQRTFEMNYKNANPRNKAGDALMLQVDVCDAALDLLVAGQDAMVNAFTSFDEKSDKEAFERWYMEYRRWKHRRGWVHWLLKDRGRPYPDRPLDENALAKVKTLLPEYFQTK